MKLSLNWIKQYVDLPADMDLSKLAYDLTMTTVEVEGVSELAAQFDKLVVGLVTEVLPHPNADKLRLCKTDIGGGDIREIVCGGVNVASGMKVAVALPGAMVRWHGEGAPVEIGVTKVRGIESFGMICASSEIGLFDLFPYTEEATILDLSAFDAPAGTPLADALDLNDYILEIDNKSMTNRPDLWGHYGIARELSAIYSLPLAAFPEYQVPDAASLDIEIDDTLRCPRYIGLRMEGLKVKPAPYAMQSLLWRVGIRPINALVDITNYVMLATGQPTHAFDSDNIVGHITVRRAAEGEGLLLLNGKELKLSTDDLVIADDKCAVALAGVMGGAKDSVLPSTSKVILEIANFDALSVRRTAARYDNRTEAATRYEKSIDPERCQQALALSLSLFALLYPDMKLTGFSDVYPNKLEKSQIHVSMDWLERRLGKRLSTDQLRDKLEKLGFTVDFQGDDMHVCAPSWRSTGDIANKEDIMEEVARMYGYENFEATPITTSFASAINQVDVDLERRIKEYLAFRCGLREIFTYPWMNEPYVKAVLQSFDGILSLSSPPSPEEKYLRSSLLPNLCKAVADNQHNFEEFSIFETAQVLRDTGYSSPYDKREALPQQRKYIAGAFVGSSEEVTLLFRRAKGIMEAMPRYTHMENFEFRQTEKPVWADNTVWLNILSSGKMLGNLALLSAKTALDCGIKRSAVVLFELDISALTPYSSRTNAFVHLPAFPLTNYDVSVLLDSALGWDAVYEAAWAKKADSELLRGVSFVGEYTGKQVPPGKKSLTLRLLIGSPDKTLTSGEIESCAKTVIKRLSSLLQAELRS